MSEITQTIPQAAADADQTASRPVNVGHTERWLSIIGGGGLVACGLSGMSLTRLLGLAGGAALIYRGWSGHCDLYGALGLNTAVEHNDQIGVRAQQGVKIVRSVHINRGANELHDTWKNLDRLPDLMRHVVSVTPLDATRSHWVARSEFNQNLEWDAEIINDRPGEVIAWRSLPESEVDTAGSVHFQTAPNRQGTEVTVSLKYDPPGGRMTARLARLFGVGLEQEIEEDLRAFKQMMEAGEVATSAATRHDAPHPAGSGEVAS